MSEHKLELKHLGLYLPYGVEVETPSPLGESPLRRKLQLDLGHDFNFYLSQNTVKLVLKPIKSITEDDLALMFMSEFGMGHQKPPYKKWDYSINDMRIIISHSSTAQTSVFNIFESWCNEYWKMDLLASKHYDVFGLIEKGLAVPK